MEVLLVGNTDFITKQWIQHAFPQDHVVIAEREGTVDGNDRLRIVNMSDANALAETITTYEFDRIVFFSENLTPHSDRDGDLGALRRLLHAIRNRQTQMLMVSGPESEFTYPENADVRDTSKSLMSRASEELCLYYARLPSGSENHSLPILVRSRLKLEGVVQCGYVKNDGERFMLTILTDNRSMDDTMWVFERKDLL